MAARVEPEVPCGVTPNIEQSKNHLNGQILNPQFQKLVWQAVAELVDGNKRNVWTEGIKEYLQYDPERLRDEVAPMDNPAMLSLVGILQERHTYIVTKCILEELGRKQNLPS